MGSFIMLFIISIIIRFVLSIFIGSFLLYFYSENFYSENRWPKHKRIFIESLRKAQGCTGCWHIRIQGPPQCHLAWCFCFSALSLWVGFSPHGVERFPGAVGACFKLPFQELLLEAEALSSQLVCQSLLIASPWF